MNRHLPHRLVPLLIILIACGGPRVDASAIPELPPVSAGDVATFLENSEQPVVLNVWASWCVPCRSEAPLLERASEQFDAEVRFVGLNVRDSQDGARAFIAEFFPDAPIAHWFDSAGDIPVELGGSRAVPLTFFYGSGGEMSDLHTGVLDERTLALGIDELLAGD